MLEHPYDIRMWESNVDPNLLMVERQDPDNCIRFQSRERCALEIAAYVFKNDAKTRKSPIYVICHLSFFNLVRMAYFLHYGRFYGP